MTRLPLANRPTAVYRLFSADDELLYVGITHDLKTRLGDHGRRKAWWPAVSFVPVEWCDSRAEALRREAQAIVHEAPRFNARRPDPRRIGALPATPARETGTEETSPCVGVSVVGHVRAPIPDRFAALRALWASWHPDPNACPAQSSRMALHAA